jgi:exopolysaccharide biosynthesis polyprenyl glycosylphosphotransferase
MLTKKLAKYLLLAADFAAINLALAAIFWIRYRSGWFPETFDPSRTFGQYGQLALIISVLWITYFFFRGLYRDWSLHSRAVHVALVSRDITLFCLLLLAVIAGSMALEAWKEMRFLNILTADRLGAIVLYWLIFLVSINGMRLLALGIIRGRLLRGTGLDCLLILGATEAGRKIRVALSSAPELGWKASGYVDQNPIFKGAEFDGLPVLGKYSDLPHLISTHQIGGLIISHESSSHNEILRILSYVAEFPVNVFIVPDLYDAATGHFKTNTVHGIALKELFPEHMPSWEANLKRILDITVSVLALAITFPLLLIIALLIRLDSRGPVLYAQERVGQYGRIFLLFKFRTMRTDAEAAGPQWASQNDPRITRLGRFLRKTRIDELPQLWNVLVGDMSLVGPRPEREHFINQLRNEVPLYLQRLKMKPGLTGWAQVKHHYDTNIEDVKTKVLFDLWYFENMSLPLDIVILMRTVWVVFTGKGAR